LEDSGSLLPLHDRRQTEELRANPKSGVRRRFQGDLNADARTFQPEGDDPAGASEIVGFSYRQNVGGLQRFQPSTNPESGDLD